MRSFHQQAQTKCVLEILSSRLECNIIQNGFRSEGLPCLCGFEVKRPIWLWSYGRWSLQATRLCTLQQFCSIDFHFHFFLFYYESTHLTGKRFGIQRPPFWYNKAQMFPIQNDLKKTKYWRQKTSLHELTLNIWHLKFRPKRIFSFFFAFYLFKKVGFLPFYKCLLSDWNEKRTNIHPL